MNTESVKIPLLKKITAIPETEETSALPCCTPKRGAAVCCTPSKPSGENNGACCAQPSDGTPCCNK